MAKGITINGLAIINEKTGGGPGNFLYLHTHPAWRPAELLPRQRDRRAGLPSCCKS